MQLRKKREEERKKEWKSVLPRWKDAVTTTCISADFDYPLDPAQKPEIVKRLSDRHFGIGGDGVIFINPSEIADFEMEMWNADGTRGEMCGNGIRCVGKFVFDKGMTDQKEITVESFGKVKYLTLFTEETGGKEAVTSVRVNMGEPILDAPGIPVSRGRFPGRGGIHPYSRRGDRRLRGIRRRL